jgi:DNA-binding transcriptional MerR regulator
MGEEELKIREALDAGYPLNEIRAWYITNNKELPSMLQVSEAEQTGVALPKSLRLGMTALQGPTFGFADELIGAATAPFTQKPGETFAEAYQRNRDIYRAGVERYKEEQPIGSAVAQTTASLPLGMLNIGKTVAPNITGVPRAIASGGLFGLLGGAGEAESVADIPEESAKSAALGSLASGGTETVLKAVRPVAGSVKSRIASAFPDKLTEYFNTSSADLARRRVAQAMLRDGMSVDQVQARLTKLGDDAVLADAAKTNVRDLLDTMATLPGRTKNMTEELIRQRQIKRGERLTESAQQQLSPSGQRLADTVENLIIQRQVNATPFYDQLKTMNATIDDELKSVLEASKKLGAFKQANLIATAERKPFSLSKIESGSNAPVDTLDLVKRGLDQLIESPQSVKPNGEYTTFGRSLINLKNDLLKKLDDATIDSETGKSVYAQARSAFAGPTQLINSAELGRTILSKDAGFIRDKIKNFTESELESFRVGAYEGLRMMAGTQSGQNRLLNMWKERATQEKLKEIFPSERSYREFLSDVLAESRKKGIESVGRGSQTASREARMEDVGVETLRDLGTLGAAAKTMDLQSLVNMISSGMQRTAVPQNVRDEIGRVLMGRNPEELRKVIEMLQAQQRGGAVRSGIIGTQLGVPAVEPLTEGLRSLLQ